MKAAIVCLFAALSAVMTGALFALGVHLWGSRHAGMLAGVAIIAGGLLFLILMYAHQRRTPPPEERSPVIL